MKALRQQHRYKGKPRELGDELDIAAQACHSTLGRLGQKSPKFKASLDYIENFKKKWVEDGGEEAKAGRCSCTL